MLVCPIGHQEPLLLEPDGAMAVTSPMPRWFRQLVRHLEQRWGMELQAPLLEGDPFTLDLLGFEALHYCRQSMVSPLGVTPEPAF